MQKNKFITIAILSVAFLVIVGTVAVYGVGIYKRNKLTQQADALVAIEKYQDGINIYEQVLSNKYNKPIADKRDLAIELMESEENYNKGMDFLDMGNYQEAVKSFSKVSKNDKKRYEQAMQQLNDIEEFFLEDVAKDFEMGHHESALAKLDDYIRAVPASAGAKNLKSELEISIEDKEKKKKSQEEEIKKRAEAEKSLSDVQSQALSIKNTYQTVVAKNANLRAAPKIDADVITVIQQGVECYVIDTKVESADRFWCKVRCCDNTGYCYTGWISYNTMNYKF